MLGEGEKGIGDIKTGKEVGIIRVGTPRFFSRTETFPEFVCHSVSPGMKYLIIIHGIAF